MPPFDHVSKLALVLLSSSMTTTAACKKSESFEGEIAMRITRPGAAPSDMTFEAKGPAVRLDLTAPDGQKSHAIVQPDGKTVLIVDAQKAWMEMDMSKAAAAVAEADPSGAPDVTKTGKHETVAGYDCEDWTIRHTAGKRTEACIAEGLAAFNFGNLLPGATPASSKEEVMAKRLFPLRSVDYDATGKELSRMEVTKIERKSVDASTFAIPAGFTKLPSLPPK